MSPPRQESEAATRRKRVDPLLKSQGWEVVPYVPDRPLSSCTRHAITEYPTEHGPADYVLVVDGMILGAIEAKRVTLGPQNVLVQAERYSKGLAESPFDFRGYRVPFLYSTNGEVLWFHDIRHPLSSSRRIAGFHTPAALAEMLVRDFDSASRWLAEHANNHPRLRPYQVEANTAIELAIARRKRLMLVAMATGTGKTFTMVNQTYRLMESKVGKRILFLVDRRALAAQAVRAFASFEPEPNKKFDKIHEVYSQRFSREQIARTRCTTESTLFDFSSHSQITRTSQPARFKSARTRRSRLRFFSRFCLQKSAFVAGALRPRLQECMCQKQPFRKMATLLCGNAKSGFPGKPRFCDTRHPLMPSRISKDRNLHSVVFVPCDLMRPINRERAVRSNLSTFSLLLADSLNDAATARSRSR